MRIALLTDGIPPYVIGGMQKHSRLLAEYLARSGEDVILYHCVAPGDLVNEASILDSFSKEAAKKIEVRTFTYEDKGKFPGHYLRAQKALSKEYLNRLIAETIPPDFIYSKGFVGFETLFNREKLPFKCPIGVKFHGMNMFQKQADLKADVQKYMLRGPVKAIMKEADIVFSYGGKITDIIEKTGIQRKKILEIPAGIEQDWIKCTTVEVDRPLNFLFVGRYDRVKGLPELYTAIQSSQFRDKSCTFHFIGDIPESSRLDDAKCIYHGRITDMDKIKGIYDQCDVLINVSFSEGMPNVILEAMARGLAILATNVGATSLLVQNNGVLIDSNIPKEIANGIQSFLMLSDSMLLEMKKASLDMIEQFTWEQIVNTFRSRLLNQVLK